MVVPRSGERGYGWVFALVFHALASVATAGGLHRLFHVLVSVATVQ